MGALEDQQLGGLIMWVPGGLAYLLAGLALAARGWGDPRCLPLRSKMGTSCTALI